MLAASGVFSGNAADAVAMIALWFACVVVPLIILHGIIRSAVLMALREHEREKARQAPSLPNIDTPPASWPDAGHSAPFASQRYRVTGVVRQTGGETRMSVEADSLAAARAKAEARGVAVTNVERA